MKGYLGEFPVDISQTEFEGYAAGDWAMHWIGRYGQIDGDHHKLWVLDQVARILKGTPVVVKEARWENGEAEFRVTLGEPSQEYEAWVSEMRGDDDDYGYDVGIAP